MSGTCFLWVPAPYREPLRSIEVLSLWELRQHNLNQRYPVLIATTGSCARPDPSSALSFHPKRVSLQVAVSPCCDQPLPNVNPPIFLHVQASLPRLLLWCFYPFLPTRQRPSQCPNLVGADAAASMANSVQQFQYGTGFRGCNDSLMFKPVSLIATLIAPTAAYRLCRYVKQLWLLRPRIFWLVTSPDSGYTNRPLSGN